MNMTSPFIINPLIQYVKTGENAFYPTVKYFDTKDTWLSYLTPEKQYGLSLGLILVLV
jgi:hypothetical protein